MPEGATLFTRLPRGAELGVPQGATLLSRLPRGAVLGGPQGAPALAMPHGVHCCVRHKVLPFPFPPGAPLPLRPSPLASPPSRPSPSPPHSFEGTRAKRKSKHAMEVGRGGGQTSGCRRGDRGGWGCKQGHWGYWEGTIVCQKNFQNCGSQMFARAAFPSRAPQFQC